MTRITIDDLTALEIILQKCHPDMLTPSERRIISRLLTDVLEDLNQRERTNNSPAQRTLP